MKTVGEIIKEVMKEKEITPSELSILAEIPYPSLNGYLRNRINIPENRLIKISDVLGVDIKAIIAEEEKKEATAKEAAKKEAIAKVEQEKKKPSKSGALRSYEIEHTQRLGFLGKMVMASQFEIIPPQMFDSVEVELIKHVASLL